MILVHLQRHGHRPIALVGGGTGMIGDPSGKSVGAPAAARRERSRANAAAIRAQLERFLDFDGPDARRACATTPTWLSALLAARVPARHRASTSRSTTCSQKDSVKSRMDAGISFTEFSYMLLQAYDFLELHRRDGVTLQLGGSDQWGNITAGIELIRRADGPRRMGSRCRSSRTSAGTKFGKTEAGAVWLDAERTSPYAFYQFWLATDDRDVGRYLRFFTLLPRGEIEALDAATRRRRSSAPRSARSRAT